MFHSFALGSSERIVCKNKKSQRKVVDVDVKENMVNEKK